MLASILHRGLPIAQRLWRSPLFLIGLTGLTVLLLSHTLQQQQQQQLLDTRTQHYGEALTRLAARQAIDATLNHDLVSLQVAMQDITQNPHLLSATIHDVENRLLVQAGSSPNLSPNNRPSDYRSYTSPITLHDSVAGYVTVTIDINAIYQQQDEAWLLALAALFISLIGWCLLNHTDAESNTGNPPKQTPQSAELPQRHTSQKSDAQVNLLLQSYNLNTLNKQLSGSKREHLFKQLERQLSGINTLYNGQIIEASGQQLMIKFSDTDSSNACFRAICAAQLLFQLQADVSGLQLEYSAAVVPSEDSKLLSEQMRYSALLYQAQIQLQAQKSQRLVLNAQHQGGSQLEQRLQLQPIDNSDWLEVEALQPSYQALLDKQVKQLQQMFGDNGETSG